MGRVINYIGERKSIVMNSIREGRSIAVNYIRDKTSIAMNSVTDAVYGKKKPNIFWNGNNLVERDSFERCIDDLIGLETEEGRINVASLFGPFLDLKNKETYRKKPEYIDLYVWTWTKRSDSGLADILADKIKEKVESWPQINGLNVKVWIGSSKPFDCLDPKITGHFPLYQHPDILEADRIAGLR